MLEAIVILLIAVLWLRPWKYLKGTVREIHSYDTYRLLRELQDRGELDDLKAKPRPAEVFSFMSAREKYFRDGRHRR